MKKRQENPLRLLLCWAGPDRIWRILSAVSDLYRTAGVSRSGYYNGSFSSTFMAICTTSRNIPLVFYQPQYKQDC